MQPCVGVVRKPARLVEVFADLPATEVAIPNAPDGAAESGARHPQRNPAKPRAGRSRRKIGLTHMRVLSTMPCVRFWRVATSIGVTPRSRCCRFSGYARTELAEDTITKSPDRKSANELASEARPILDKLYAEEVERMKELYDNRVGASRGTTDLSDAARAATYGAIEALLVDIDEVIHGTVDETTGAVTLAGKDDADNYDVIDEVVSRA